MASASKPKCKYWDKCYQKGKAHKANFLHPGDKVEDVTADVETTVSDGFNWAGKRIVFTGVLCWGSKRQATEKAEEMGCEVATTVTKSTDLLVIGNEAGVKLDKAKQLGIKTMKDTDWFNLIKVAESGKSIKKDGVDSSGDKEEVAMETDENEKKIPVKRPLKRAATHGMSDSDSDDEETAPPPTKKRVEEEESTKSPIAKAKPAAKATRASKKEKCKYWEKCYRKDKIHLKEFLHPSDGTDDDDAMDVDGGAGDGPITPINEMADGETVDIRDGAYRIKRTGDNYYCTCQGWKNQKAAVDVRTCKHLKSYLGEEFEAQRVGQTADSDDDADATPSKNKKPRHPRHKTFAPLLLAHKWTESVNPKGWWLSEKLDGVRAYWDGQSFYSRLGNEFCPPDWFIDNFPKDMTLDGELFGGRGKFQSTVSIVKHPESPRWKELTYEIFDVPSMGKEPFEKRIKAAQDYFEKHKSKYAVVLKQEICTGVAHMKAEQAKVDALDGEGLMIRKPNSKYEHGRSHSLLKIKTFHDAEAIVIGHDKGKGKNSNVCGALRCRMACGIEFSVGSGMTDANRRNPPKKGSIINYRFQELTGSGTPRFPTFVGICVDKTEPKDADVKIKGSDN